MPPKQRKSSANSRRGGSDKPQFTPATGSREGGGGGGRHRVGDVKTNAQYAAAAVVVTLAFVYVTELPGVSRPRASPTGHAHSTNLHD